MAAAAAAGIAAAAVSDDDAAEDDGSGHAPTAPGQVAPPALRTPSGAPADTNPALTIADFGPAPIGVPNFVIDQFTIPPFLLPIYQACGTQYGIPWQVLASINRIETAFGTNTSVSTAGALGWMQFIPSTWQMYGVDANNDNRKDPYNPVDAICAAARYLKAAGGETDLRTAIFAYNHADWYVDEVLLYANQYERLPADLVGSLTGLTEGARFPVAADSRYADDITERRLLERVQNGHTVGAEVSDSVASSPKRRAVDVYADEGSPVLAVNDGVIEKIGHSDALGDYIVLQDTYGNHYTYAQLGRRAEVYPAPRESGPVATDYELPDEARQKTSDGDGGPVNTEDTSRRLFALPERQRDADGRRHGSGHGRRARRDPVRRLPQLRALPRLHQRDPAVQPQDDGAAAAARGLAGGRGDAARPGRRRGRRARPAPQLLDPPRRPRRADDRPEADPRRLEAARGDGALPGRRQGPVRHRRHRRSARSCCSPRSSSPAASSPTATSRSTSAGARTSPPDRSTGGCWRCSSTWSAAAISSRSPRSSAATRR